MNKKKLCWICCDSLCPINSNKCGRRGGMREIDRGAETEDVREGGREKDRERQRNKERGEGGG